MKFWRLRRDLYRGARLIGDIQAVERGPTTIMKRAEQKWLWRLIGRWPWRV
jgi:hypothetical protein